MENKIMIVHILANAMGKNKTTMGKVLGRS